MSLLKTYTKHEIQILKEYGLYTGNHSQLSDSFVAGYRKAKEELDQKESRPVKLKADGLKFFDSISSKK